MGDSQVFWLDNLFTDSCRTCRVIHGRASGVYLDALDPLPICPAEEHIKYTFWWHQSSADASDWLCMYVVPVCRSRRWRSTTWFLTAAAAAVFSRPAVSSRCLMCRLFVMVDVASLHAALWPRRRPPPSLLTHHIHRHRGVLASPHQTSRPTSPPSTLIMCRTVPASLTDETHPWRNVTRTRRPCWARVTTTRQTASRSAQQQADIAHRSRTTTPATVCQSARRWQSSSVVVRRRRRAPRHPAPTSHPPTWPPPASWFSTPPSPPSWHPTSLHRHSSSSSERM